MQRCSSSSSFLSDSPTTSTTTDLKFLLAFGGIVAIVFYVLIAMVPGGDSSSSSGQELLSRSSCVFADERQWIFQMEQYRAISFILAANAYWIYGEHDQTSIENMFNQLRLACLLLKNGEADMVDLFLNFIEVKDDVGIMEQVGEMKRNMHLTHVNLLHAQAWLWEESKTHIKKKVDEPEHADFFTPMHRCLEHKWDISPGDSDRLESSRSSIANRSRSRDDSRDSREIPPREYEIRITTDVPREEAVRLAQEIADQHGRDLVVELPERVQPEAEQEGERDGSS